MSAPRKERRPLLIGLFASIMMGSALVLPDPGLADTGKSPSYVRMDQREDTGEGRSYLAAKRQLIFRSYITIKKTRLMRFARLSISHGLRFIGI